MGPFLFAQMPPRADKSTFLGVFVRSGAPEAGRMEKWKEKVRVCAGEAPKVRARARRKGEKCPRGTRQDRIPAFSVFAGDFSSPAGPDLHNYGLRE